MSTNLATLIGGPCLVSYKGSTFRSQADVTLNLALDTFDVVNDLYGAVDKRVAGQPIKVAFTPEGRFADLTVLFPHVAAAIGSLITPRWPCGAVNTGADTIAVANTSLPSGTPVSFGTTGTMPAGLTAATVYYLGADSSGVRKVFTTSTAAIAGSGQIDLTTAGTGSLAFIETYELVILGNDGTRVTLHNAAVTKMPAVNPASQKTLWSGVEFECFAKNGIPWTTADAFYTIDTAAFADSGFDPADIITQPYSLTWGSAPWSGIYTKNGFVIEPSLTLEAVEDDVSGILTRRISSLVFTAKAQPEGPDLSDVLTALKLQGAGATRGRSLAGSDLNIQGTGVYVRLYAAALVGGPAQWSSKLDRVGELTWQATRTFTMGVANPLFFIGSSAPS
jgi:hypothetical protein